MKLLVAYSSSADARSVDTETTEPEATAAGQAHAVQLGSAIAVCGTPALATDVPWPPASGAPPCPRCLEAVRGFTVD